MALEPKSNVRAVPLRGGCVTANEKASLPFGSFSMLQNMRNRHPGIEKRGGCRKLHTTADGTNEVLTLYQYDKSKVDESHFYGQFGDGDVLESTTAPPGVTTGAFGSQVFSGESGQIPASWSTNNDVLFYSNGVDQHQAYAGDSSHVEQFIVMKASAAVSGMPTVGEDYTAEVTGKSGNAILDSIDTYANHDCLWVRTPVRASGLGLTIALANGNAATASVYYRKSDGTWADTSASDGTADSGATMAQDGDITWTMPSDEVTYYAYGVCGWWYQIRFSAALDAEVEVSGVTFQSDWQSIANVWDGVPVDAIEVHVETGNGDGIYNTFSAAAVDVGGLEAGAKIVLGSFDKIEGVYCIVGSAANTASTTLSYVKYWNGSSMSDVGTETDGTNGLNNTGWILFPRQEAQPFQFEKSQFYIYWYEIAFATAAVDSNVVISIMTMPYFDVDDFGAGRCNCSWKNRELYTFSRFPEYIYPSAAGKPFCLNGADFEPLQAGDGRSNRVVAMVKFHNELMAFQEEKGVDGGSLTLFQGYNPATFGKLILDPQIGTFSAKTVAVVPGAKSSAGSNGEVKTTVYFLSHQGVCVTDGRSVAVISDDIQNYFDPKKTECIRRGYEDKMYLKYDSADNVLRIGLVSGSSATANNIFPIYDLVDGTWGFDDYEQPLSCMANVTAKSGNVNSIQVGGGTADGTVYQLNYGDNDVDAAIDGHAIIELDGEGESVDVDEIILRCKSQTSGNMTVTSYDNENLSETKTLAMTAERSGESFRRHRESLGIESLHPALKIQNAVASQKMYLIDLGVSSDTWEGR